jgi:CRP-like cAMP-binding protein
VHSQHLVKNRILRQLSIDELKSVQPWLTLVQLQSNVVLHEQGGPIEQIYFPLSGMISLLAVMQSGEAIETGIVGADGLLGGDAPVNGHLFGQATVQMDGAALTMPKAQFLEAYNAHPHLRNLVNRYQSILLMQAQQNAACHALHSVRSRLCRWMLQSQDMIGSDTFILTQEFLSHMLGVRRNTVSVEAHRADSSGRRNAS